MRTPSPRNCRLDLAPPLADRIILGFPIDYDPVLLLMPFGFPSRWTPCPPKYRKGRVEGRLSGFSLRWPWLGFRFAAAFRFDMALFPVIKLFRFLRPARNFPRFWIWCSSF